MENATSLIPSNEARNGSIPSSIFSHNIFNDNNRIIDKIPMAKVRPISVKRFKSYPRASIIANVMTDVGIARADTIVAVTLRKSKNDNS